MWWNQLTNNKVSPTDDYTKTLSSYGPKKSRVDIYRGKLKRTTREEKRREKELLVLHIGQWTFF